MTTPQFIAWLDRQDGRPYGKLIPPPEVLEAELDRRIENKMRAAITERILREAELDDQVAAAIAAIKPPDAATLARASRRLFKRRAGRDGATTSKRR